MHGRRTADITNCYFGNADALGTKLDTKWHGMVSNGRQSPTELSVSVQNARSHLRSARPCSGVAIKCSAQIV
jgi:hypothetical protein